jgi:hypothetical protein
MQFDLAAGYNSVASDAETAACGCSDCGPHDTKIAGRKRLVFFMMVEAPFWKLPQPTSLPLG